jgi:hypothetical protein
MQKTFTETSISHFKSPMIPSQTIGFHHELSIKNDMLVKLCVGNYVTLDYLVNGFNDIFFNYK